MSLHCDIETFEDVQSTEMFKGRVTYSLGDLTSNVAFRTISSASTFKDKYFSGTSFIGNPLCPTQLA